MIEYHEQQPDWVEAFLREYRRFGLVASAAEASGTTVRQVNKLRKDNEEFAYAMDEVTELIADRFEQEAIRRAVDGIEKGVYYKGELVNTERQYSDTLLLNFLKAKRRSEFGDKKEITGADGEPLTVTIKTFTPEVESSTVDHVPVIESSARRLTEEVIKLEETEIDMTSEIDADELA